MVKQIYKTERRNVFPAEPKYKVKDLKDAASFLKKQLNSKVAVSKMTKSQLIKFLNDNNYLLSEVATFKKVRAPRKINTYIDSAPKPRGRPAKPKMFGPSLARGMTYKKLAASYAKSGNTQLAAVIPPPVVIAPVAAVPKQRGRPATKPKFYGPSLASGMSYKKLAENYAKSGNTQLAAVLPSYPIGQPAPSRAFLPMPPATFSKQKKQRGRPKGSKNKPKA